MCVFMLGFSLSSGPSGPSLSGFQKPALPFALEFSPFAVKQEEVGSSGALYALVLICPEGTTDICHHPICDASRP